MVPKSKRKYVFKEAHSGKLAGHLSARRLTKFLRKTVFWENMERYITKWSRECKDCLITNVHEIHVIPLKPFVTKHPYELVGVDLVEFGMSERGNKYALTFRSANKHFTKFIGAYPIPDKTARTVAGVFFER